MKSALIQGRPRGSPELSAAGRRVDASGLALFVIVLGCLLAVPSQHRIVERGMATMRIQRAATRFADYALMPFALGVGCAVYVATGRAFGVGVGTGTAIAATVIALILWYGLGIWLRRGAGASGETAAS